MSLVSMVNMPISEQALQRSGAPRPRHDPGRRREKHRQRRRMRQKTHIPFRDVARESFFAIANARADDPLRHNVGNQTP
jgi:hypothetical protein